MIRLGQPWSLLVLVFFAFVLVRLGSFPRGSAVRRGAAWLCLCVALASPEILWGRAPESTMLVLDLSSSAARSLPEAAGRLQGLLRGLPAGHPVGVVVFARQAYMVTPPTAEDAGSQARRWLDRLASESAAVVQPAERDETDIAAGLDLAAWGLGAGRGGHVILASDGWETRGDARRAARDLGSRGIAVDVLPLQNARELVDAGVEDVEAPGQVFRDVPFEVRGTIRSTVAGPAGVSLIEEGSPVARQDIRLSPGDNPVRFVVAAETPGERRYGIRVAVPGDQEPRNDVAETEVVVAGRPRVLWIGTDRGMSGKTDLEIVHAGPGALAGPFTRLKDVDAVVLANVALEALPEHAPLLLRHYVESDGGGFLMTGGVNSFGPGGYRGTAIEDVLPVDLDPQRRERRQGLALVLALDKSGSMAEAMGARSKIAAARDAVMITVGLLDPGDRFGLLSFDSKPARTLALQEPPAPEELRATLAGVEPRGGTLILPALSEAAAMLAPVPGWRRHIVLVTDGKGEGGDFTGRVQQLAAAGISLSVIAVGDDADVALLQALARGGRGRFEVAQDAGKLAAALRREVVLARGPVIHDGATVVLTRPHPVLANVPQPVPPLRGYISAAPRPFAAVPLLAETGDAVLALARFGLGRTAALMTDLDGPWGAEWQGWPGASRLLAQVLHWILRTPVAGQVTASQAPARDGWVLTIHVEDADGNRLNGHALRARLRDGRGAEEVVPLEQRGPGTYGGTLVSRVAGPTAVIVEDRLDGENRLAGRGWIGMSYPDEHRVHPGPNASLLEEVRQVTGGRSLEKADSRLVSRWTEPRVIPLAPWLALLALGLLLLDLMLAHGFRLFRRQTVAAER